MVIKLMDKQQAIIDQIPRLRRFARALSGDAVLADDLVQDCLERALKSLHSWRDNTNMNAWLVTILRNLYINQLRAVGRRPVETNFEEQDEMLVSVAPVQGQRLHLRDVGEALQMLPDQHREVILLVALEGMSYDETADILGIQKGTVMSRLSRARSSLNNLMNRKNQGDSPSIRRVK